MTPEQINELQRKHGDAIPVSALRDFFADDKAAFILRSYVYDPTTDNVFNAKTGRMVAGATLYSGPGVSRVTMQRGIFILKHGFEPRRCEGGRYKLEGDKEWRNEKDL